MVLPGQVDAELETEVRDECQGFGTVEKVRPTQRAGGARANAGMIR